MEIIEIRVPLTEEELRKLLKSHKKPGVWSKLFGVARNLPEFQENDRMDARV